MGYSFLILNLTKIVYQKSPVFRPVGVILSEYNYIFQQYNNSFDRTEYIEQILVYLVDLVKK